MENEPRRGFVYANNIIDNNNFGFTLDNFGLIGQQGDATQASDNIWLGSWNQNTINADYYKALCINSFATNSPLFVQLGNSNYEPSNYANYIIQGNFYDPSNNSLQQGGYTGANLCPAVSARNAKNNEEVASGAKFRAKLKDAENLVLGNSEMPDLPNKNLRLYVMKLQLYQALLANGLMLQQSPILRQFVNENEFGSYHYIHRLMIT